MSAASLSAAAGPVPTMRSTVSEIEAYASGLGIDLTGAANKAERLALIDAALGR